MSLRFDGTCSISRKACSSNAPIQQEPMPREVAIRVIFVPAIAASRGYVWLPASGSAHITTTAPASPTWRDRNTL
ncbi:MAG: hypothetical protein O8C60_06105 [Candidatus Methanoperedens sp.]|nr:hypothetical protein [Candidatus Methanoperedens sp.]